MNKVQEFIARLRSKPEHVRQRIALGTTSGVTAVVALVWVVTLAANGTFSLGPASGTVADSADSIAPAVATTQNSFTQLLGAAGAAGSGSTSAPTLTIVDGGASSTLDQDAPAADATVIPF